MSGKQKKTKEFLTMLTLMEYVNFRFPGKQKGIS